MCKKGKIADPLPLFASFYNSVHFGLVLYYYKLLDFNIYCGFLCFSSYLLCFNPSQLYYAEIVPSLPGGWLLSLFDIIPVVLLVFAWCLGQQDVPGSSFT